MNRLLVILIHPIDFILRFYCSSVKKNYSKSCCRSQDWRNCKGLASVSRRSECKESNTPKTQLLLILANRVFTINCWFAQICLATFFEVRFEVRILTCRYELTVACCFAMLPKTKQSRKYSNFYT